MLINYLTACRAVRGALPYMQSNTWYLTDNVRLLISALHQVVVYSFAVIKNCCHCITAHNLELCPLFAAVPQLAVVSMGCDVTADREYDWPFVSSSARSRHSHQSPSIFWSCPPCTVRSSWGQVRSTSGLLPARMCHHWHSTREIAQQRHWWKIVQLEGRNTHA